MNPINENKNYLLKKLFKICRIFSDEHAKISMLPDDNHVELINTVFRLFQAVRSSTRFLNSNNIQNVAAETAHLLEILNERRNIFTEDERIVVFQGMDFLKQMMRNIEETIAGVDKENGIDLLVRDLQGCISGIELDLRTAI